MSKARECNKKELCICVTVFFFGQIEFGTYDIP